ncbi:mercuric reductase [Ferrovum sp. JA12]|uniref:FAD-dependent oxidoreductase n=1 Tax=Ferrovum sp. JA12 TaxID=1356299 RepID=UPI0007035401|nr:bifunctional TVP38/TMEM64 family protein/FAD-dependent oxidoreductase [Ferrovum sp. JA12]KRH78791.1 mercuric reductase [Ferrovum sp. JA12]
MKKVGLLSAIVLIIIFLLKLFHITDYLTLAVLNTNKLYLQHYVSEHQISALVVYFFSYVLATSLSLPGAMILTLAAGFLFGNIFGVILVSFASTIGATLAMLVSRFFLRDWVQSKFSPFMAKINEGIIRDGKFYLLSLRLLPVMPFFVINLLMGLTNISVKTFFVVSQLGMLAGTIVYVNAGTQLSKIKSLSDISSPKLILSFIVIALLPLLSRCVINAYQQKKVYKPWHKPQRFDRNMIVIGAGAAGLVTSYISAAVKAKVTLIEAKKMGGDCLNYGCVPSKALIKNAKIVNHTKKYHEFGITTQDISLNWKTVFTRILNIIQEVAPHDSVDRYEGMGVEVRHGYAKLIDPWTVEITGRSGEKSFLTAKSIVLATGAKPFVPTIPGIENINYLTSDSLWEYFANLDKAPQDIVVLGGGPIGCELSQALARLGVQVTLVEKSTQILIREDEEVSNLALQSLMDSGVNVLTQYEAIRFEKNQQFKKLFISSRDTEKEICFDEVIIALGREARLTGYGLENLGIDSNRKIVTNEYLETIYPNIYAAGDVVGSYQFTHTAAHQAWYAAVNALFGRIKKFKVDYSIIPWVTFLDPEIARVGLNEKEAKQKNIAYDVTRYDMKELDRAITESETSGFIKVLTKPGTDHILGVTIVSAHAGEQLSEFVLAMKHKLGLNKILGTIHPYPTWNEANKYLAGEWKRAHISPNILRILDKYHQWGIK